MKKFKNYYNMYSVNLFNLSLYELHLILDLRNEKKYKNGFICSSLNIPENCENIEQKILTFISDYGIDNKKAILIPSSTEHDKKVEKILSELCLEFEYLTDGYESFKKQFEFLCYKCNGQEDIESALNNSLNYLRPYPSLILTNNDIKLYIGNMGNSLDKTVLKNLNITHVLNITKTKNIYDNNINYIQFEIEDDDNVNILNIIELTNNYLANAKGNILVHCNYGKSRSVSIVCGFLIYFFHISYENSIEIVKKNRSIACPNEGFQKQLKMYSKEIN